MTSTDRRSEVRFALPFAALTKDQTPIAGGKAANLGELTRAGMPVPPGYVVTAAAFRRFLADAGLTEPFSNAIAKLDVDDPRAIQELAADLRARVMSAPLATDLADAITAPYQGLGDGNAPVAVRSSATAEDSARASFAGMNESFLGVRGRRDVGDAIRRCWASFYGPRVLAYRRDLGLDEAGVAMAVVVQVMVDAAFAGVMLTEHPDGGPDRIAIEAASGLGEVVVGGRVTPDTFTVDKKSLAIVDAKAGHQQVRIDMGEHGTVEAAEDAARHVTLSGDKVVALAEIGRRIERHYGGAQDIEWVVGRDGAIAIVQTRPITSGRAQLQRRVAVAPGASTGGRVLVRGRGSGFGIAAGRPVVIDSYDPDAAFENGDVLVTRMTAPDWFPLLRKAAAVVTDEGGATSHAAIVVRELGIPGVVGSGDATRVLRGVARVTVDGRAGVVREGDVVPATAPPAPAGVAVSVPVTATEIWVNLSAPDRAAEIAAGPVDGVGLVRAEVMLLAALGNRHPEHLRRQGKERDFVEAMRTALVTLARPFGARPVVYRTHDFRTNEFRALEGGAELEPVEANPMIGVRGCVRYLRDPALLRLELQAVREARRDCPNLALMLPFVRTAAEIVGCTALLRESGLGPDQIDVHAMAEVPSIIDNLQALVDCGFRGISIGSNDLTQLLLGVDRDNETLAAQFDARDPAVLAYLERLIARARALSLHTAICGQAPSLYPDFADRLVAFGIDAISVNADAVVPVRRRVAAAEQRILLRAARQ